MFQQLETQDEALYESAKAEKAMVNCSICNEELEEIQLARHIIKKHSTKE